ncbi:MAG: hypothetical protein PHS80_10970 [Methanothrix sp.]|nr:hypothetical protein [Methanothrix sp.]MDD4447180.1 hypothetical protein [Methanothrix sp.]
MSEQRQRKELQEIAAHVVEVMDGLLYAMQKAAEQISSGWILEDIDDAGYHLYLARKDPKDRGSRAEAVMSTMEYDQFFHILEKTAAKKGLCLEEETMLEIELPGVEFEENMVTGGFEKYKGLAIEHHNKCLDELIVAVCDQLKKRGLAVACVPDEDVIFYMPVVQAKEGMRL